MNWGRRMTGLVSYGFTNRLPPICLPGNARPNRPAMTIHPRPDQEAHIQKALQAGVIHSALDVIDVGLEHLRGHLAAREQAARGNTESLVEFFRNSPLVGVELDIERNKDTGRDIDL